MIGDSIQMMAEYEDEFGVKIDTIFTWSVMPDSLGYFNSENYFLATHSSKGFIYAQLDTLIDSVEAHVKWDDDMGAHGYLVIKENDNITTFTPENKTNALPEQFELLQNYPNPFNPITTIEFRLAKANNVSVTIFAITGQEVIILSTNELTYFLPISIQI